MADSRVVIVTGGASGIGHGIVQEFTRRGETVVIADKDDKRGTVLESSIRDSGNQAIFVHADVRIEADVQRLMEQTGKTLGRIDILCNNAGIELYRCANEYTADEWNSILEINLRGAFLCTKYAYPFLKRSSGCIIHISSVQAFSNETKISAYAASKAGLLALTRGMALDFAHDGVRVNAVCPGAISTSMMEAFLNESDKPDEVLESIERAIPLGRMGRPEDIAQAVCFLASPAAEYITGASLVIDGGLLCKLAT